MTIAALTDKEIRAEIARLRAELLRRQRVRAADKYVARKALAQ